MPRALRTKLRALASRRRAPKAARLADVLAELDSSVLVPLVVAVALVVLLVLTVGFVLGAWLWS